MLVQLYGVTVHGDTTRTFSVPAYDVPIIRALWDPVVRRKANLGQRIEIVATGKLDFRGLFDERIRIKTRDYNAAVDGDTVPAWKSIYPNDRDLDAAWREAAAEGTDLLRANEAAAAKKLADEQAARDLAAEEAQGDEGQASESQAKAAKKSKG